MTHTTDSEMYGAFNGVRRLLPICHLLEFMGFPAPPTPTPLYIDDTPSLSIFDLRAKARRLSSQYGIKLIVLDYLQLMTIGSSQKTGNREQEISTISRNLKALAKELSVPVVALSQLSRAVEARDDKKPQLSDLRESGSIEQDADVVMFVYREGYYLQRKEPREATVEHAEWQAKMNEVAHLAQIIIGKQRHGPIGNVTLEFEERFKLSYELPSQDFTKCAL